MPPRETFSRVLAYYQDMEILFPVIIAAAAIGDLFYRRRRIRREQCAISARLDQIAR